MSSDAKPKESKMLNEFQIRILIKDEIAELSKNLEEMAKAWKDNDMEYLHELSENTVGLTTELMALQVIANDPNVLNELHKTPKYVVMTCNPDQQRGKDRNVV